MWDGETKDEDAGGHQALGSMLYRKIGMGLSEPKYQMTVLDVETCT